MSREYKYWDKVLAKNEKVVREKHRVKFFDNYPPQYQLNRLYKKGKLTEEQYEDLTVRTQLYKLIRACGYVGFKRNLELKGYDAKTNKYIQKYYYEVNTVKRYTNGKTFSEMFDN